VRVIVIGGGIAGASVAWALAERGITDVVILEREPRPGHHASGRSAAALVELATDLVEARLLHAGGDALRHPPAGFADRPLLRPTGTLELLDAAHLAAAREVLPALRALGMVIELVEPDELRRRFPELTAPGVAAGAWMPTCGRIDVAALLAGFLDGARRAGADLRCGAEVRALRHDGRAWLADTAAGAVAGDVVINAAGPWVAHVAALAGALPIRFSTRRRTVVVFDPPAGRDYREWPLIAFESARFYIGPEGDALIASPMDEDEVAPCDAAPDPAVIAATLDKVGTMAALLAPARIRCARAGLRTFAPDGRLVIGPDPAAPAFHWLAGQGGIGMETCFAYARIAAELIATGASTWPDHAALAADRFMQGGKP
jgi:D-arginine dehydrogenase